MSLFKEWNKLAESQTQSTFAGFWEKYSTTEERIYKGILSEYTVTPTGTVQEMIDKYEADPVLFMGFLDGINSSLKEELDLESITPESTITLKIDLETLYFNMLKADADYLFNLPEWDRILTDEKREEIEKEYRKSKTVRKEKEPGRNDPCPCGSGKKYKKCCGAAKADAE